MVRRGKQAAYRLWIEPEVHEARQDLPGNIRQRIRRVLDELSVQPHPSNSKALDVTNLDVPRDVEILRIRLEQWRILYAVNKKEGWVWVLGLYRRPPYQHEDLQEVVSKLR